MRAMRAALKVLVWTLLAIAAVPGMVAMAIAAAAIRIDRAADGLGRRGRKAPPAPLGARRRAA